MQLSFPKLCFLSLILLFMGACKKPNLNDYKGDTGDVGADAKIKTQTVTVRTTDWHDNGAKKWEAIVFTTNIDQNVVNAGSVQASIYHNGSWKNLPLPDGDEFYLFGYEEGKLHLYLGDSHGSIPEEKPADTQFKIVTLHN